MFGDNGKLAVEFTRLKKSLHKIVKKDQIELFDFSSAIINFSKSKYRNQISKIKCYLSKLETGEHVSLRDMYNNKEGNNISPEDRIVKIKQSTQKKLKNDQSGHSSS